MAEYIKREAAVKFVLRMRKPENGVAQNRMLSIIQMDMLKLPAADVAPVVHGRWVPFHSEAAGDIQYCSACEIGFDAKTDYCPHCGAKMGGGDGDACVGSNDFCSYGERKDGES